MADADKLSAPNPWHPITDARQLKLLGKLGEEATELGTAIFRCIIQGVDEAEPVTKKVNRTWLQEEIADVLANLEMLMDEFKLDREAITIRKIRKIAHLAQWHRLP